MLSWFFQWFLDLGAWLYSKFLVSPVVSVCGVVVRGGELLLVKSYKGWSLPGGAVKKGELIVDGLVREVREETGLIVRVGEFIGFFDEPRRDKRLHSVLFAFKCEVVGGSLKSSLEGEPVWVSVSDLPSLLYGHDEVVRRVLGS